MTQHSATITINDRASNRVTRNWPARRLKLLTRHIGSGKTPRGGAEVYVDSGVLLLRSQNVYNDGLRLQDVAFIDDAADEDLRASRVCQGDVLLNITGASLGRCAFVRGDIGRANVNQHVCIVRPLGQKLDGAFLHYAMISDQLQSMIFASENGISREGLNFHQLGNLELLLPPLDEQRAIATFLDRETAKIDELIAKKERLIALTAESRMSFITRTVTCGMTPEVEMKPSQIESIETIPRNWSVLPFRRVLTGIEQGWSPQADQRLTDDDEWAVLKVGAVLRGRFRPEEHKALPPDLEPERRFEVKEGDLLLTRGNTPELVADVCVVPVVRPHLMLSDLHYRLALDETRLSKRFACYWLLGRVGRQQIEADAHGTSNSMVKVSQSHIRSWLLLIPPLDEQQRIVDYLDTRLRLLDALVAQVAVGIGRLREYRAALISAAVAGQIDVRIYREVSCL